MDTSAVSLECDDTDDPDDLSELSIDVSDHCDHYTESGSELPVGQSAYSPKSDASGSPSLYPKVIKIKKTKQHTLEGTFDRVRKFSQNDERAKMINNLIAEMICIDLQPFTIVENKGFLKLLTHLEPRYTCTIKEDFFQQNFM